MKLPPALFAPSFRRQRTSTLFAVIVAFMVFAATLSVVAETTLSTLSLQWDASTGNMLTVEIPAVDDEATMSQAERVQQSLAVLRAMPNIARASVISDAATAELLKPWITNSALLRELPIPTLIDIERIPNKPLTAREVINHLSTIVADVRVDDHAAWLGDLQALVRGLVTLGSALTLLATLTLGIAVSLFCRIVIAGEAHTMTLLHVMGADDRDIARHFQALAIRLSWPAALGGFALAAASCGGIYVFMSRFIDFRSLDQQSLILLGFAAILVPIGALAVTALSARLSAAALLRSVP